MFTPHTSINHYLRVATWNIRVPFPPDVQYNLSWKERRRSIAYAIETHEPDLLAVQEDCYFMNEYLMNSYNTHTNDNNNNNATTNNNANNNNHTNNNNNATTNKSLSNVYNRYGLFNRNGESHPTPSWPANAFSSIVGKDGEHNSVWYNKHRFVLLENITFWLSHTPIVEGSSFDEVTGRIVNCVLLQEKRMKKDGESTSSRYSAVVEETTDAKGSSSNINRTLFFFCSTHLPSDNTTRQLLSVDVLSQMFSQYRNDILHTISVGNNNNDKNKVSLTMMIAGDFNSPPGSATYNAMVNAGFIDTRQLASRWHDNHTSIVVDYTNTTNDWYGGKDSLIDYVWMYQKKPQEEEDEEYHKQQQHSLSHLLSKENVISVKHIPIPCCDDVTNLHSDYIANDDHIIVQNRTASDHKMVIVDFEMYFPSLYIAHFTQC